MAEEFREALVWASRTYPRIAKTFPSAGQIAYYYCVHAGRNGHYSLDEVHIVCNLEGGGDVHSAPVRLLYRPKIHGGENNAS